MLTFSAQIYDRNNFLQQLNEVLWSAVFRKKYTHIYLINTYFTYVSLVHKQVNIVLFYKLMNQGQLEEAFTDKI